MNLLNQSYYKTRPEILERIKRIQECLPTGLKFSPGEPTNLDGQLPIESGQGRIATINFPGRRINYFPVFPGWLKTLAQELKAQDEKGGKFQIILLLPAWAKGIKIIYS